MLNGDTDEGSTPPANVVPEMIGVRTKGLEPGLRNWRKTHKQVAWGVLQRAALRAFLISEGFMHEPAPQAPKGTNGKAKK
jgi:hypothetical protein